MHPSLSPNTSKTIKRPRHYHPLSLHHKLFLIYVLVNIIIVTTIYIYDLLLHSLSLVPLSILGTYTLSPSAQPNYFLSPSDLSSFTPVSNESSDQQKLSYLSTWQSMASKNIKLMKFSDSHPICINTGASCCISNNKRDFIDLNPTQSSTVLKGIGSGLTIAGSGTSNGPYQTTLGMKLHSTYITVFMFLMHP
jgi:hypothetical protein